MPIFAGNASFYSSFMF